MKSAYRSVALSVACFAIACSTGVAQTLSDLDGLDDPLKHCKVTIIDEISVPAEEMGVLDTLDVREGMLVEKGQLLGTIDTSDAELALEIAKFEYAASKKTADNKLSIQAAWLAHEVAIAEYDASMEANARRKGTVTQTEIRRKKLQADRAKMQAELAAEERQIAELDSRAKHKAMERAKASLDRREIRSRINGVVVKVNKHAGEWVQPGDVVMRIVRMDQLRVEGDINGRLHARHEVIGRPVSITVKLTGGGVEKLEGTIVFASPIVESNEYTVRAEIDNRKMTATKPGTPDRWLITPGLDAEMELGGTAGGLDLQFSGLRQ